MQHRLSTILYGRFQISTEFGRPATSIGCSMRAQTQLSQILQDAQVSQ